MYVLKVLVICAYTLGGSIINFFSLIVFSVNAYLLSNESLEELNEFFWDFRPVFFRMKRFTSSALFSKSHFCYHFRIMVQTLLNRIKVLEDRQRPSVANLRKGIVQYALRQNLDFDKYRALELIAGLKNAAILCKDKKADFYTTVHIKLLERMDKPAEHFKGYILALTGDREYEEIMESVAKIDKSLAQATSVSSNTPQLQDNNASYSFPPPYGYPSLPPYQGVIPQLPYNYQPSFNYPPSPYYPSPHPGPSHYRSHRPSTPFFFRGNRRRGSGNGGIYCYFCGGPHRIANCYTRRQAEIQQNVQISEPKKKILRPLTLFTETFCCVDVNLDIPLISCTDVREKNWT